MDLTESKESKKTFKKRIRIIFLVFFLCVFIFYYIIPLIYILAYTLFGVLGLSLGTPRIFNEFFLFGFAVNIFIINNKRIFVFWPILLIIAGQVCYFVKSRKNK